MGSGDWFKGILCRKKMRQDRSKKVKGPNNELSNGSKLQNHSHKVSNVLNNGASSGNPGNVGSTIEEIAAIRIQTTFRRHRARKILRHLKGLKRLQVLGQGHYVKNQTSTTLSYLQSWSRIQAEIRARRICMVTEGRIKQKKQENQLKLEAKIHDLEVEWSGGSETMEETLARIQQREEASVKRERAMAYAFTHQWRANAGLNQGQCSYEFGKGNWGWSWMERWIAARPWETRITIQPASPIKAQTKEARKVCKNTNPSAQKVSGSVTPAVTNGKSYVKRTSPQPGDDKTLSRESKPKTVNPSHLKTKIKQEQQKILLQEAI